MLCTYYVAHGRKPLIRYRDAAQHKPFQVHHLPKFGRGPKINKYTARTVRTCTQHKPIHECAAYADGHYVFGMLCALFRFVDGSSLIWLLGCMLPNTNH